MATVQISTLGTTEAIDQRKITTALEAPAGDTYKGDGDIISLQGAGALRSSTNPNTILDMDRCQVHIASNNSVGRACIIGYASTNNNGIYSQNKAYFRDGQILNKVNGSTDIFWTEFLRSSYICTGTGDQLIRFQDGGKCKNSYIFMNGNGAFEYHGSVEVFAVTRKTSSGDINFSTTITVTLRQLNYIISLIRHLFIHQGNFHVFDCEKDGTLFTENLIKNVHKYITFNNGSYHLYFGKNQTFKIQNAVGQAVVARVEYTGGKNSPPGFTSGSKIYNSSNINHDQLLFRSDETTHTSFNTIGKIISNWIDYLDNANKMKRYISADGYFKDMVAWGDYDSYINGSDITLTTNENVVKKGATASAISKFENSQDAYDYSQYQEKLNPHSPIDPDSSKPRKETSFFDKQGAKLVTIRNVTFITSGSKWNYANNTITMLASEFVGDIETSGTIAIPASGFTLKGFFTDSTHRTIRIDNVPSGSNREVSKIVGGTTTTLTVGTGTTYLFIEKTADVRVLFEDDKRSMRDTVLFRASDLDSNNVIDANVLMTAELSGLLRSDVTLTLDNGSLVVREDNDNTPQITANEFAILLQDLIKREASLVGTSDLFTRSGDIFTLLLPLKSATAKFKGAFSLVLPNSQNLLDLSNVKVNSMSLVNGNSVTNFSNSDYFNILVKIDGTFDSDGSIQNVKSKSYVFASGAVVKYCAWQENKENAYGTFTVSGGQNIELSFRNADVEPSADISAYTSNISVTESANNLTMNVNSVLTQLNSAKMKKLLNYVMGQENALKYLINEDGVAPFKLTSQGIQIDKPEFFMVVNSSISGAKITSKTYFGSDSAIAIDASYEVNPANANAVFVGVEDAPRVADNVAIAIANYNRFASAGIFKDMADNIDEKLSDALKRTQTKLEHDIQQVEQLGQATNNRVNSFHNTIVKAETAPTTNKFTRTNYTSLGWKIEDGSGATLSPKGSGTDLKMGSISSAVVFIREYPANTAMLQDSELVLRNAETYGADLPPTERTVKVTVIDSNGKRSREQTINWQPSITNPNADFHIHLDYDKIKKDALASTIDKIEYKTHNVADANACDDFIAVEETHTNSNVLLDTLSEKNVKDASKQAISESTVITNLTNKANATNGKVNNIETKNNENNNLLKNSTYGLQALQTQGNNSYQILNNASKGLYSISDRVNNLVDKTNALHEVTIAQTTNATTASLPNSQTIAIPTALGANEYQGHWAEFMNSAGQKRFVKITAHASGSLTLERTFGGINQNAEIKIIWYKDELSYSFFNQNIDSRQLGNGKLRFKTASDGSFSLDPNTIKPLFKNLALLQVFTSLGNNNSNVAIGLNNLGAVLTSVGLSTSESNSAKSIIKQADERMRKLASDSENASDRADFLAKRGVN